MPKRIPVKALSNLAKEQGLKQSILLAWDGDRVHVVTHGDDQFSCDHAAQAGDKIKEYLQWDPGKNVLPSRVKYWKDKYCKLLNGEDHGTKETAN